MVYFRFILIWYVFVKNNEPAAALASVCVVARAYCLNKVYALNVFGKIVYAVVTEKCRGDIARSDPAFELKRSGFWLSFICLNAVGSPEAIRNLRKLIYLV